VFGTSGSGKTCFINFLHEYAQTTAPPSLIIGDGNHSTTQFSTLYDLEMLPIRFPYSDEGSPGFQEPLFEEAFDNDYNLDPTPLPVPGAKPLRLQVADTPGLDDSEGKDEEHIIGILKMILRLRKVVGVIFVVNSTTPFSGSFLSFLKYYRNLIPQVSQQYFIVHTRFGYQEVIKFFLSSWVFLIFISTSVAPKSSR